MKKKEMIKKLREMIEIVRDRKGELIFREDDNSLSPSERLEREAEYSKLTILEGYLINNYYDYIYGIIVSKEES